MTIRLPPGVFFTVPPVPMLNAPPPPPPPIVEGVVAAPMNSMNEGVAAKDGFPPAKPRVGLGVAPALPPKPNVPALLGTGGAAG